MENSRARIDQALVSLHGQFIYLLAVTITLFLVLISFSLYVLFLLKDSITEGRLERLSQQALSNASYGIHSWVTNLP